MGATCRQVILYVTTLRLTLLIWIIQNTPIHCSAMTEASSASSLSMMSKTVCDNWMFDVHFYTSPDVTCFLPSLSWTRPQVSGTWALYLGVSTQKVRKKLPSLWYWFSGEPVSLCKVLSSMILCHYISISNSWEQNILWFFLYLLPLITSQQKCYKPLESLRLDPIWGLQCLDFPVIKKNMISWMFNERM